MKATKKNIGRITLNDYIKANRIASREMALEDSTGWTSVHKAHTSKKAYKRTSKHKVSY